jgi:hypothetical protein
MPAPTYNITIEQGADWTTAGAKWDLFMVTSAGVSTRLLQGSVALSPRITVTS